MRTKPGGSPRGLRSQAPVVSLVARQTNGERSMNRRVASFRRSAILAQVSTAGSPISVRSSASVRMSSVVRGCVIGAC
jgi:hypothetical protein